MSFCLRRHHALERARAVEAERADSDALVTALEVVRSGARVSAMALRVPARTLDLDASDTSECSNYTVSDLHRKA